MTVELFLAAVDSSKVQNGNYPVNSWTATFGALAGFVDLGPAPTRNDGLHGAVYVNVTIPPSIKTSDALSPTKAYALVSIMTNDLSGPTDSSQLNVQTGFKVLNAPTVSLSENPVVPGSAFTVTSTGWVDSSNPIRPDLNLWGAAFTSLDVIPKIVEEPSYGFTVKQYADGINVFPGGSLSASFDTGALKLSPGTYTLNITQYMEFNPLGLTSGRGKTDTFKILSVKLTLAVGSGPPKGPEPIIFLPGVGGSELFVGNNELWPLPNGCSGTIECGKIALSQPTLALHLGLGSDGTSIYDISPSGAIRAPLAVGKIDSTSPADFYGQLIKFLTANGYAEGKTLFTFPYDWRMDNAQQLGKLDELINTALKLNPDSQKVVLLAHSMGGLISRAYILSYPGGAAKVDSLITIGTPFWGAPMVYYAFVMGYNFGDDIFGQRYMKFVEQNFSAAYELLPQIPFIRDSKTGQELTLDQAWSLKYKGEVYGVCSPGSNGLVQLHTCGDTNKDYFTSADNVWSLKPDFVRKMQKFYAPAGSQQSPTKLPVTQYAIVGYGVQTLVGFRMVDYTPGWIFKGNYLQYGSREVEFMPVYGDGDGTVPIWSSVMPVADYRYYIKDQPDTPAYSASHSDLPSNPTVQAILLGILKGQQPPSPALYPYTSGKLTQKDTTDLTLHSNAQMSIVDGSGRVLGYTPSGGVSEGLGTFLSMDGVQFASIGSNSKLHTIFVNGTSSGSFTLDVNVTGGGRQITFSYANVPVANGTIARLSWNPDALTSASTPTPPALMMTTGSSTMQVQAANLTVSAGSSPTSTTSTTSTSDTLLGALVIIVIPFVVIALVVQRLRHRRRTIGSGKGTSNAVQNFCVNCGTPLIPGKRFCTGCGKRLGGA